MPERFVAYYRVSTAKQGQSGLGLEAQRSAVLRYLNGGDWQLSAEFTEVESGKRSDNRPQLMAAMEHCRLIGAKLVIAKLDRLSRNVAFLSALMESDVGFVACDNPHATTLTIHILAAIAQEERAMISKRTKEALAVVARKRAEEGKPSLGGWRGQRKDGTPIRKPDSALGATSMRAKADAFAARVLPTIQALLAEGKSLRQIAAAMGNVVTANGGKWDATRVRNVLVRSQIVRPIAPHMPPGAKP